MDSDDEFLFDTGLIDTSGGNRGTAVSSDDEGGSDDDTKVAATKPSLAASSTRKRKGAGVESNSAADDDGDDVAVKQSSTSSKKRTKNTSSKNLLIEAGRGIARDTVDAQALFLSTIYSHSLKMSEGSGENDKDDKEQSTETTTFSFGPHHLYCTPESTNEKTRQFNHTNLASFLKSGPLPAMKRLKNWKHPNSPMVLIVTLSARRSVELMKQLSTSLKLPIAKLFAKHLSVEDQVELLQGGVKKAKAEDNGEIGNKKGSVGKKHRCYSLAVGTPGRLLKLLRHGREEPGSDGFGALRLNHTELVILDCHEDSKGWNVCTLKDTSKELMEFTKEGMVPQLEKRRGKIKLAMF